jgi:outer membrane protein assembly factor BamA
LKEFKTWQKQQLEYYENNGYPFVNIRLSNYAVHDDSLHCSLMLFKHKQVVYDTLQFNGNSRLSKNYLGRYLDVKQGDLYNEKNVKAIDKKLRNLPLVKLKSPTRIVFYQGKARIILAIDEVVTDRIDGVVGFAPNSSNATNASSLLITGEVNLELNNLFRNAKKLELHWRNYLQNSQLLDVGIAWPYIANTKLGLTGNFNLNKFDTVFLNVKSKIGFNYQQQANNYLQAYYQNISSNLITADTNQVRSTQTIPDNNPYRVDNYGIAIFQRNYDYLPNPRRGFEILADVNVGTKTILRNTQVDQVLFFDSASNALRSIYDTLNRKSFRSAVEIKLIHFIPIKKNAAIKQQIGFNALFAEQVFFNELYNYGGFSTLRGFDENEIFASKSLTYLLELRYLLAENSNVGLFFNASALENKLESSELIYDVPLGFGAVANIQVGGGILNLAYALGSRGGNPLQFSSAKFHFGIINYF